MAQTETRVRWLWGYDADGNQATVAEAVGFVECRDCDGLHPCGSAIHGVGFPPAPLPGRHRGDVVGWSSSEFPPD